MRWTVRNKMLAMGLLVFIALVTLAGVSYRTNCHSGDAADTLELRSNQIATLNKFKQSLLTLNLAAMDAIVDKAQGSVSADVMNEIREAATYLRNSLGGLRELADHPDEQQFVADIERGIQEFLPVVEQQLVAAIRAQDGDEVFAALDDEIDGSLTVIMEKFDLLLQDVENEALEATEELHGVLDTANGILITIILVVLALLTPAGYLFARGIVGPLRRGQEMIAELEAGHLDRRLNLTNQDEIGDMARSMDAFADSLQREVVENLQLLAAGDLCFDVTPRDDKDMLRSSVKKVSDDLQELLVQIQQACHQIATGSNEVSDSSQSLSQGATQSASSLEEIAASMTEMASQTKLNADNAEQANQLSIESKKAAERGNDQMTQMVTAMGEINESGQNISKIIKVIDEIAFQTNLLALNAAVEAARAGQHGKGFAVVAEEVRNLAARSAKAANETSELIEGSVKKAANGAEIADVTAAGLGEIVDGITKVSDLVGEIAAASHEQANGIHQVNQGLGQIDQVTQQNTASAEEGAAASEELSSQAEQLRQMIGRFKLKEQSGQTAVPQISTPVYSAPQRSGSGWGGGNEQPMQISLGDDGFSKF